MKLAIYGRTIEKSDLAMLDRFFAFLHQQQIPFILEEKFKEHLGSLPYIDSEKNAFSDTQTLLSSGATHVISFGGDGTLLETLLYIKDSGLAVMGINMGRLGFLSNVPKENAIQAIETLLAGHYRYEKRTVIELKSANKLFSPNHFALNDFTIHKRDTGSMITIDMYLNGEFFNTYWADGIIVSTPTGSTAYSLSCGGPVIFPDSGNFVITPVAPHNLNIRPIVVADSTIISFRVRGRGANHLISLDSRYEIIDYVQEIAIQKAAFFFNLIKLNNQNFIDTLREKLKWGLDNRNA
ncbi:MAG: NAD kinase [Sphingobacteriales bacterium]|nr:MAG: NAD kinase [Sphingobacteriales bacterium]